MATYGPADARSWGVASQHAQSDDELHRHAARSSRDLHGRESQPGRVVNFTDDRKIFELLRRSHAPIEDHQIVEMALRQRRPGMVERRWVIRGRWRWSAPKSIARQRPRDGLEATIAQLEHKPNLESGTGRKPHRKLIIE